MEDLKELVTLIGDLPQLAVWVLLGFLVYKLAVVGSVYGLIRFAIEKTHSWLMKPKIEKVEVRPMLDGMCISGQLEPFIAQLHRLRNKGTHLTGGGGYLHDCSVQWLKEAIDEKEERERKTP